MFAHPIPIYLGSILSLAFLAIILFSTYAYQNGASIAGALGIGLILIVPSLIFIESLIDWTITNLIPPRILPKLKLKTGVPANFATMVVMPILFSKTGEVTNFFQQLELHYLRNPSPNLYFALLADLPDAPEAVMPEDQYLIQQAIKEVQQLNKRYSNLSTPPFYLFIRERLWNPAENKWIGWERKRGKLHEFNRLLRGGGQTSYQVIEGDLGSLGNIQFVITLDADTILPRETALQLIGTLAHPLNRAKFDRQTGKVTSGYTVLQPRVDISPTSANQTLFSRIFSGNTGLDLYSQAVSDVYQDLFGTGIYVGKGIYAVDAFERSLLGRVPENSLLSHDLFEGVLGRVGLVSDLSVIEDIPAHYQVHVRRMHRWVRGDWQLLPWLFPKVPISSHQKIPNDLSWIDRWKIFDNLLRSLIQPVIVALLILGWTILPGSPWVWSLIGALALSVPVLTNLIASLREQFQRTSAKQIYRPLVNAASRWLLTLSFLPYEASRNLDAIVTTLYRIYISKRQLLEWTTAAHTERIFMERSSNQVSFREVISATIFSLGLGILISLLRPEALWIAIPFLISWAFSPQIAHKINQPTIKPSEPPAEPHKVILHRLARRTWLYFEHFVGPEDHWLPPDHFQENPLGVVAHRTSPTNIGVYLLAVLGAYDLGYISLVDLMARLGSTVETMGRLTRYRGHFLNWYDTRTLEPLLPEYVSTVDSGNLIASLIALRQGVNTLAREPILRWQIWEGLMDTLGLVEDVILGLEISHPQIETSELSNQIIHIREQILSQRMHPNSWIPLITSLTKETWQQFAESMLAMVETERHNLDPETLHRLRIYIKQFHQDMDDTLRTTRILLPWLIHLNEAPKIFRNPDTPVEIIIAWQALQANLPVIATPLEIEQVCSNGKLYISRLESVLSAQGMVTPEITEACDWCNQLNTALDSARMNVKALLVGIHELDRTVFDYFRDMDFSFLFDARRKIFRIGYNATAGKLDENYYDLLASEARIASLVTIAKGDVPQIHWLHLNRPVTQMDGTMALLSWSATMFEYLMPELLMRSYPNTLMHQSIEAAVKRQIEYGKEKGVPWGISESGYFAFDADQNYQYRAFGVPGLGFKRGLANDLVITPYASLLALPVRPKAVLKNIEHLEQYGMMGVYGLYEAIDFTTPRLGLGKKYGMVQSYMSHHQGMILLSLVNYLNSQVMVERFHADLQIRSVELLLQEKLADSVPLEFPQSANGQQAPKVRTGINLSAWAVKAKTNHPVIHLLSNGRYTVMVTNSGSGFSNWRGKDITRWRNDPTLDGYGTYFYIQDLENGAFWTACAQPSNTFPEEGEILFSPSKAEFRRRDRDISVVTEVIVPPEEDLEIRRLTITNHSDQTRTLRLLSYGEVILSPHTADYHHPAFNKLFIESEYQSELNALIFRRRPRSESEERIYMAHMLVCEPQVTPSKGYESNRGNFLGRGGSVQEPEALIRLAPLTQTAGATLDPIFSISQTIELKAHESSQVAFLTMATSSRSELMGLARRYQAWQSINQAMDQVRSYTDVQFRQMGWNSPRVEHIERLISALIYPQSTLRAPEHVIRANRKGQSGLWAFGISGDYPILLIKINDLQGVPLLQEAIQAHTYWRNQQILIDLVVINEQGTNYGQELHNHIHRLIQRMHSETWINSRGGIFLLHGDQIDGESRSLLDTSARVILDEEKGTLEQQLSALESHTSVLPPLSSILTSTPSEEPTPSLLRPEGLQFDNGLAGFSQDGKEYVIYLEHGQKTPAPWINVIANPEFGFIVSENGGGNTWAVNSGENRLTPWRNDPVLDTPSEIIYLRDEETGEVWSATPEPCGAPDPFIIRHGAGYTIFEHHCHGLMHQLQLFTSPDESVKVIRLKLENLWQRSRRITATFYTEWVLGNIRETSQAYIVPEYDAESQALLARNPYHPFFNERVAFIATNQELHGLTSDRTEFIGRLGDLRRPAALGRIGLSGTIEAGLDPCAVLQVHVNLEPGEIKEVYFLLGQGTDRQQAISLIKRYQDPQQVEQTWQETTEFWRRTIDVVKVRTPDPAMDLLLNQWLLYQALSCRIWGRSAHYQSSGAFGFRDQLQDVMALTYTRPDIIREHIIRSAHFQFEAGDVLHWWHPPQRRGVRTRYSDDLLWLPFVTAHYIRTTGDLSILSEEIPFLIGPELKPKEDEHYGLFDSTQRTYSLYEHCKRAIERGATAGPHGIPLIGGGDWNDGMNRVGIEGRGESIWLGWFLHSTLTQFSEVCSHIGENEQAESYLRRAKQLSQMLEENGWDGAWYLRAYYDDGTPLGSASNRECQIDSIAQSWAILSGAGDHERSKLAMDAVFERLIRWDDELILLFTPPFDQTARDPGYIKGYLPGIRENGGQYTHAALWTIWAYAKMGQGDRAVDLFRLINPILHADSYEKAQRYQVEPYVIAADVYSIPPHNGRGGWTWYTGSSGWMYRLGLEAILGLQRSGDALIIDPCIPKDWLTYEIFYRYGETQYHIQVENPSGVNRGVKVIYLDGIELLDAQIPLQDDGIEHKVTVQMG
jgi:cyclic beta-1,2-glucan synthetase